MDLRPDTKGAWKCTYLVDLWWSPRRTPQGGEMCPHRRCRGAWTHGGSQNVHYTVVEPSPVPLEGIKCTPFVEAGVGGVAARSHRMGEKSTPRVDLRRRPRRLRVGSAVCHESGGRGGEWGVHANYVAGLVDLGPSRDGMGWDGWMDHPPTS